ncbi:MAG: acyl-CoA dehydrogenase [Rhodothermales bacterium]
MMPYYDFFQSLGLGWVAAIVFFTVAVLGYVGAPLWLHTAAWAVLLYGLGVPVWLWALFGVVAIAFNLVPVRRALISGPIMKMLGAAGFVPRISETEQTAIEAGTVWVDGELFSGRPDFRKLMDEPYPDLTDEERAFLDGPVEEVCAMTDDWDVFQRGDLSEEVWAYLKKERFFGMIIPKEYGGLGFSALANSAVVKKTATRSLPLSITVMVPNSLGPAELLIHYGTQAQRDHYLPRLARGEEIPAFALTEANAGSDAGAISSEGVVFRDDEGELYLRLNWKKRYITLAAVSTVLGLAFKLKDPDNLLGKGEEPGITCALIPSDTPGVETGWRHDPLGVPFINSPTEGHDVVVPIDAIIGGPDGTGNGWRMLMESLSAGRGISLPAQSTGGAQFTYSVASAHASVRKQFGLQIGRFEGVEEPLARVGGYTYVLEAMRRYTCGGLDQGAKPAVVTAIAKYNATELQRKIINDGMDVLGGNGIVRGPRNLLAHAYTGTPIGITVEGANILTRTLMIFGQGAIRCHPYAYEEIDALAKGDLKRFDHNLWKHVGHVVRNAFRAFALGITRGHLSRSPVSGPAARYVKKLNWAAASFAFLADLAMGGMGGELKRKEKITGRFADIFSWLYMGTAVIRRFEAEGRRKDDEAFLHWSMQHALAEIQKAFEGLYENLSLPGATWLLRGPGALWRRINRFGTPPSDRLGQVVAQQMQQPGEQRARLTDGIYRPADEEEPLAQLEHAFRLAVAAEDVLSKIRNAMREGKLERGRPRTMLSDAHQSGVITTEEADLVRRTEVERDRYVAVDAFTLEEFDAMHPGVRRAEASSAKSDRHDLTPS